MCIVLFYLCDVASEVKHSCCDILLINILRVLWFNQVYHYLLQIDLGVVHILRNYGREGGGVSQMILLENGGEGDTGFRIQITDTEHMI